MDFAVWGDFEKRVWKNKPHDTDSLKNAIIKEWEEYPQELIDNAIDSFRARLKTVIKEDGDILNITGKIDYL